MSWLGGSLSSLTGQLSNLTKDILTEGTEEVSDHVTELRVAQERLQELDTVCVSQKVEIDRLNLLVREWEEKAESSELQINSISREYRTLLEEKDREIKTLKQQHHEHQELKSSFLGVDNQEPATIGFTTEGFETIGFTGDDHDFGENIAMQHEINRLRGNLQKIQAECQHWKKVAEQNSASGRNQGQGQNEELVQQLKSLQQQLDYEKDQRQFEISSLQDAHNHKVSTIRKKHKEEMAELKQKIQDLEWSSEGWDMAESSDTTSLKIQLSSLQEELSTLKVEREEHLQTIAKLKETIEEQKSELSVKHAHNLHLDNQLKVAREKIDGLLDDHNQVGRDLYDTKQRLLDQLDANHADTLEVLSDLRQIRQHLDTSAIDRRHKLLVEKDMIVNEMISSGKKSKDLQMEIEALEMEREKIQEDSDKILTDLGDKEHQKLTGDIVDSLEKENLLLKKKNVSLQEQVTLLEKAVQNATRERGQKLNTPSAEHDKPVEGRLEPTSDDSTSMTSDASELSRGNFELDEQVTSLRDQIKKNETEIEQFELLQADWQTEKEALEQVLVQLRGQLKEKENALNIAEAQKGLLALEKHETSSSSLPDLVDDRASDRVDGLAEDMVKLDRKIELLADANAQLEKERDMLVLEKGQLEQEIADLRQGTEKENTPESDPVTDNWNKLLKEKEEELKAIMSEKEDLENNLREVPELKLQLEQKHKEMESLLQSQSNQQQLEEIVSLEKEIEELKRKLRGKNEEIVNLSLEKEEMMSSLEELDNQHQEEMAHIIKLKDEFMEAHNKLKDKLKATESETQVLKSENEALRSQQMLNQTDESANSNELNHQIAELKENNLQLQQQHDESMKQLNQLQTDMAGKDDEIKQLKDKLESSAQSLNDLHMDKQDLQDKVKTLKDEKSELSQKLKASREKESELLQSTGDNNDKNAEHIGVLQSEINEYQEKYSKLSDLCDEQKTEINELNSKLRSREEEIEKIKICIPEKDKEIDRLTTEINEKVSAVQELEKEISSLKIDNDKLGEECKRQHIDCESFSRQVHALDSELHTAKTSLKETETENETLSSRVEMLNNELTIVKGNVSKTTDEFEILTKELKRVKDLLEESTDRLHTKCEECNQLTEEIESYRAQLEELKTHQANQVNVELMSATGELVLVKEELANKTVEWEQLYNDMYAKDEEVNLLKSQLEQFKQDIDEQRHLSEQFSNDCKSLQTEKDSLTSKCDILTTELEGLKVREQELMNERQSDETDAGPSENIPKQITSDSSQSLTSSELSNLHDTVNKLQQENLVLENEIKVLKADKDKLLFDSKSEKESLNTKIKEIETEIKHLKMEIDVKVNDYNVLHSEREKLRENVQKLEAEIARYKQVITSFETDLSDLSEEKNSLLSSNQQCNEKINSQGSTIEMLQQKLSTKDTELDSLQRKLNNAKSYMNEDQISALDNGNENGVVLTKDLPDKEELIEVEETIQPVKNVGGLTMERMSSLDKMDTDRQDIVIEVEKLQGQLKEKDKVISEMQRNNSSLLKMLDSRSKTVSGESPLVEMNKLETEVRSMKVEKEQMMDVLNEKSRENSNLKAEVQRLMNTVAAEKSAIDKLQRDNQELTRNSPDKDGQRLDDMQKEVVQNLSRMIRDKDLEIESLSQKNQTLLSVLQESSTEDSEIKTLLQDKENLTKQLAALQGEREQMITYLNQKHQESLAYHSEVQRLTAVVNTETENNQKLRLEYDTLVPQFEEKKQLLLKCQSDLIDYKQKYTDLEVKYGHLIQQSDSGESVDKALYDSKVKEIESLQSRIDELLENIKDKENKVQSLHQSYSELEQSYRTVDNERAGYKKQVDNFVFQLHGLQSESTDLKSDIAQLQQQKQSVISECQTLTEANKKLTLQLQDSEFEVRSLQEKTASLTAIIQSEKGEKVRVDQLTQENEVTQNRIKQLQQERDQASIALQQTQQLNQQLELQVQTLREKENKLNRELDRLRQHLIQIEDGYTREALASEEREKELRTRLTEAEEKVFSSSSAMESTSQQASQKLDSLTQQLEFVSQQRDQAYLQISTLQEQNQTYSVSLANLQMVLEQFQQEKDQMVSDETEKYLKEIKSLKAQVKGLEENLNCTKEQLEEASDGLEAASRLSEQLDRKEEALDALKEEVQIRESSLKVAEDELKNLKSRNDDRVDKLVIKNLFLGYFTTPANKRGDVLRAIGGVLLFSQDDFTKIDSVNSGGWMSGLLKFGGTQPKTPPSTPSRRSTISTPVSRGNNSFSEMFVQFLERESSPPPPTVRLPAEEMVRDIQKQKEAQKPAYNPFMAPRNVAIPLQTTNTSVSNSDHILMSSTVPSSYSLTTFAAPSESSVTPPGSGRNTPASTTSGAILKDVLNR